MSLVDRSMLWLKELYIQLYYENGGYEPLASDALRVGGIFTRINLTFVSFRASNEHQKSEKSKDKEEQVKLKSVWEITNDFVL